MKPIGEKVDGMNYQFIRSVRVDWNEVDEDSYLNRIEAFVGMEKIDFHKPITFFRG